MIIPFYASSASEILYYSIGKKVTTASSTSTASDTPPSFTRSNSPSPSTASDTLPSNLLPPHPHKEKEIAKAPPETGTASQSEASYMSAIHAATENAIDMLIKAKAKYKAKEISQEDYLKVADRVADYAAIERQMVAP